jgi:hypothetical protein
MDKNVILQVSMGEDESLQIMMGENFPTLVLVGLLEQVKLELLSDTKNQIQRAKETVNKQYDA